MVALTSQRESNYDVAFVEVKVNGKRRLAMATVPVTSAGEEVAGAAQVAVTSVKKTLVAGQSQTILDPSADVSGARVLNWTASPVYIMPGATGTPPSGAPSDYVPAADNGEPGQWEPPYRPVDGLRAIGASAGDLTVVAF